MKNKSYFVFLILFFMLYSTITQANVGMPGYWNVGSGLNFKFFFNKDSIYKDQIQMKEELILVDLFRGFAVVKGVYTMKNLSKQNIRMNLGYPINGTVRNEEVRNIIFGDIYHLKVLGDGKNKEVRKVKVDSLSRNTSEITGTEDWYIWEDTFPADKEYTITVYFMVNTSQSIIKNGYDTGSGCGFAYILESGRAWAEKIEKGRIYVRLNEGLSLADIRGIYPMGSFKGAGNEMVYDFESLEPDASSNLLIRYSAAPDEFDFDSKEKDSEKYFSALDLINLENKDWKDFKTLEAADFYIDSTLGSVSVFVVYFFFALVSVGMPLLIIILGISMAVFYIRKNMRKKS